MVYGRVLTSAISPTTLLILKSGPGHIIIYYPMYKCAEGIICLNNLNLPSYDLHFTEGMDQALANLAQLELSFQNMSEKINEKTAKQKAKIEELFQRISKCNQRVEQLSGEKIALFFTSPSRYVRSYKFQPENNVSIFKEFLVRPPIKQFDNKTRYEMEHNITKMGKESKVALDSLNNMVEMLYVNLKPKRKGAFEAMNRIKEEGLGNLPNDIKYLDSLLVFNSNINPYRRYQLIDNQKVEIVHKVKAKEVQDAIAIEKAPEYMNMTIDKLEVNNHGFVPMDKTIDFIDFQDDLDFDNIVSIDDIFAESIDSVSYNPTNKAAKKQVQTVETRREPKVETQKSAPAQTQAPVPSKAPPQQMTQSTTLPPPPSMPHSSSLPPPPPPPSLSSSLPLPPPPPSIGLPLPPPIGLPPPPGPPPSIGLPPPPPPSMPSAPSAPPIALNGANARSKLLGQIQNRGNIKLKKTVTREYVPGQSNAPRERSPPPAGGSSQGGEPPKKEMNHMDLLRNRLKVRYQAINPKANDDGQKTEQ